ncbi:MAG TPA: MmcQ/YjbR family DNA-binding protein [Candidatus Limnocylindria bacterium]|jgi:hypothetical protein|nr:MmcQ/YjbR family DNA-binding protein [Candidatus Limnocylindria bacterium]
MPARAAKTPETVYGALAAEQCKQPGVTIGRALMNDVLKVNDKIFAFLKDDRLVVKLPAAQAASLVADDEAIPFQTGGRTMKEWVALALTDAARWSALMDEARGYVAGLGSAPKPSRSRKR